MIMKKKLAPNTRKSKQTSEYNKNAQNKFDIDLVLQQNEKPPTPPKMKS